MDSPDKLIEFAAKALNLKSDEIKKSLAKDNGAELISKLSPKDKKLLNSYINNPLIAKMIKNKDYSGIINLLNNKGGK